MATGLGSITQLVFNYNTLLGTLSDAPLKQRKLSALGGVFADEAAYAARLQRDDPLIYTVASLALGAGRGDLHAALARLMPGRVGDEYFMTKGHYHAWREAAEWYIGLAGEGIMLLEDDARNAQALPLTPQGLVYVPGYTAHRTVNTGQSPLVYLGIYPAQAGHDYLSTTLAVFAQVVIALDDRPVILPRADYLASLLVPR